MSKIRFTTYVTENTREKLKKLSDETRIPQAQYVQEALDDLLKKYREEPE